MIKYSQRIGRADLPQHFAKQNISLAKRISHFSNMGIGFYIMELATGKTVFYDTEDINFRMLQYTNNWVNIDNIMKLIEE